MDTRIDLTESMDFSQPRKDYTIDLNNPTSTAKDRFIFRLGTWLVKEYVHGHSTGYMRKALKIGYKGICFDVEEGLGYTCDRCGKKIINGTLCDMCNESLKIDCSNEAILKIFNYKAYTDKLMKRLD